MTIHNSRPPGQPGGVPAVICFNSGVTRNVTLHVRHEHGDLAIDLCLPGKQPFAALVLTLDNALDLNLRLIGNAMRVRKAQLEEEDELGACRVP